MATIKPSLEPRPGSPLPTRPQASEQLCFGSIEWHVNFGAPMVRLVADALAVQHWQHQPPWLDQKTGSWVEIPAPVDVNVELQQPVREGDWVRSSFMLVRTGAAKQSVRVAVKPNVRWVAPGDRDIGQVAPEPAELFFASDAKRLPAIRMRLA